MLERTDTAPEAGLDAGLLIDEGKLTGYQYLIFTLCGLVGILDGWNTQCIGLAGKLMAVDYHVPVSSFGLVYGVMLLGASVGAASFGAAADYVGRKLPILAAVLLIAGFSLCTPFTHSYNLLVVTRFFLGLGLGGAAPSFIALGSEYAPLRLRQKIVSWLWLSFPLGGTVGAFIGAYLLGHLGWQSTFYAAGGLSLLLLVIIPILLPESLQFLITKGESPGRVHAILQRLRPDLTLPATQRFFVHQHHAEGSTKPSIFVENSIPLTLILWLVFSSAFAALIALMLWGPGLLALRGMSPGQAAIAAGASGFGGMVGTGFAGHLMDKFGDRALGVCLFIGAVAIFCIGLIGNGLHLLVAVMLVAGFFVGITSSGNISMTIHAYPLAARSRGLGLALSIGRLGQFVAPLVVGLLVHKNFTVNHIFFLMALLPLVGGIGSLFFVGGLARKRGHV